MYLLRNKVGDEDQLYTQIVLELMVLSQGFGTGSFKNVNLNFFQLVFLIFTVWNKKIFLSKK